TRVGQACRVTVTSRYVGKEMTILLNGTAIMSPVIREPIMGGSIQISDGSWTEEETKSLASQLSAPDATVELDIAGEYRKLGHCHFKTRPPRINPGHYRRSAYSITLSARAGMHFGVAARHCADDRGFP